MSESSKKMRQRGCTSGNHFSKSLLHLLMSYFRAQRVWYRILFSCAACLVLLFVLRCVFGVYYLCAACSVLVSYFMRSVFDILYLCTACLVSYFRAQRVWYLCPRPARTTRSIASQMTCTSPTALSQSRFSRCDNHVVKILGQFFLILDFLCVCYL